MELERIMLRPVYLASWYFVLQAMETLSSPDRLIYGSWDGKPGDKLTQALNVLFILVSLWLFQNRFQRLRSALPGVLIGLGAVALLFCSAVWSIDPDITIRRAVLYLFVVVGSIGIAGSLEADEFMRILKWACGLSAVACVLLLIVAPAEAQMITSDSVDFRGIFSQKNVLGQVMAAGVLASLHGLRVSRRRATNIALLGLFTVVAVMSKSATSVIMIVAFCAIHVIAGMLAKGGPARALAVGAIVLLLPMTIIGITCTDSILELIGKDPTLTGRTELWSLVWVAIDMKPILGWGYSAFWFQSNPMAVAISNVSGWFVPEAHNGLLELLLDIGWVGAAYFFFVWGRNFWLSLKCIRTVQRPIGVTSFSNCIGLLILGVSESVALEPFQISTCVFFVTGIMCERAFRVRSGRRRRATSAFGSNLRTPGRHTAAT
jgi:exopolysaccharide production protein ExoQ